MANPMNPNNLSTLAPNISNSANVSASNNSPQSPTPNANSAGPAVIGGGRFDFDDGGTYCGGWHDGKAHGHGICTGPKGQGEYSGSWHYGFEISGVYKWPSGATYEGNWQNGKRHGLGVEYRGKWVYKGEWTQGFKGRYGIRASLLSTARYEGTWANGLQDGYGSETYADGGTYQGQWLRGMRHGYGIRTSAPYGNLHTSSKLDKDGNPQSKSSSLQSLDTEGEEHNEHRDTSRGGFVLVARVSASHLQQQTNRSKRRNSFSEKTTSNTSLTGGLLKGLRLRKQRSTGDLDLRNSRNQKSMTPSLRSSREGSETRSTTSTGKEMNASQGELGSNASFLSQDGDITDQNTVETYHGEWKNDKRAGFGVCERSDGLRYEGEWFNNKKYGYGVTTFPDGTREEGKYKNNMLITNIRKKHLFMIRSQKLKERIESAVAEAHRAQQIALQKCDIATSRTATARSKSEQADYAASSAQNDSQMALIIAKQYGGGDFGSPGQGSIAPLRRRLSDFSHVRRIRDEQQQNPGLFDSNQQPNTRLFLDPNEPFGGRRGSFRRQQQMLNQDGFFNNQSVYPFNTTSPTSQGGATPHLHPQNRNLFGQSPHFGGGGPNTPNTPKDEKFSQAFTDRFDHYVRGETPDRFSSSQRIYLPGSQNPRTTPSSFNLSSMDGGGSYSPTPSPSPSFNRPTTPMYSPSPTSMMMMMDNNNLASNRPPLPAQPTSQFQSIPPLKSKQTNVDANIENESGGGKHLRTASLYRPGTKQNPPSSNPSSSIGAFQRKPSLQPNVSKQLNKPLMTREEASILSHRQREHRRIEQEYQQRLSHNPLLYLWSPTVINWLNRQKLVILVFIINVSIAYLFIRMIVS
ncbi:hypothetical protein NH340_JMT07281 [Sarcoptes scabiei]|nr:hypothetical protein NH340_JMT07281 [Sarcoptes scabiei]